MTDNESQGVRKSSFKGWRRVFFALSFCLFVPIHNSMNVNTIKMSSRAWTTADDVKSNPTKHTGPYIAEVFLAYSPLMILSAWRPTMVFAMIGFSGIIAHERAKNQSRQRNSKDVFMEDVYMGVMSLLIPLLFVWLVYRAIWFTMGGYVETWVKQETMGSKWLRTILIGVVIFVVYLILLTLLVSILIALDIDPYPTR